MKMNKKSTIEMPTTLIREENGLRAYDDEELSVWMKDQGLWEKWSKWANGNTCAILNGYTTVFIWDVESFLKGKPNFD